MSDYPPQAPRLKLHKPESTRRPNREHYGARHQRLRRMKLEAQPLCEVEGEGCTGWASEAHHLIYPAVEIEHYLSVCSHCHDHHVHPKKLSG